MGEFPDIIGDIDMPTVSPVDAAPYEVDVNGDMPHEHEPMSIEGEAKEYFNSVTEGEALNYIMMLHDMNAISFDRLNQLKEMLDDTPSFLPKEY